MNIIKKLNKKKRALKHFVKNKIHYFTIDLCRRNAKLSIIYYALFNKALSVSSYKILNAVNEFSLKSKDSWSNISTLVRNIHRLEKALCIKNSTRVFALDFIGETLLSLEKELGFGGHRDKNLLVWSGDILDCYFQKFPRAKEIEQYRVKFNSIRHLIPRNDGEKLIPYDVKNIKRSSVSLKQFEILSKERKSVRFYDENKEVEVEKLLKAVEISMNTPTACNKFPLKFHFITKEIDVKEACKIPYGITCFSEVIPVMCFLISDLSGYHKEAGMLGTPYVDAGLTAANFMYAIELQGLSSCPINWTQSPEKEKEAREFLNLKPYETCTLCFTIGYKQEDSKVCFSQRKSLSNAVTFR